MALVARISEVEYEKETENEDGTTSVDDLSLRGYYYVKAEYVDSNNPDVVLLEHSFDLPNSVSEAQAQEIIIEYGQRVRDARVRVGQLKRYVGATIPIP